MTYTIKSELFTNEEGSDFATVTITWADGATETESFARWIDSGPIESAAAQAASFVAAFEETQRYTLEERLGPFGLEWEREQEERGGYSCGGWAPAAELELYEARESYGDERRAELELELPLPAVDEDDLPF